jgi:hypothetical protein
MGYRINICCKSFNRNTYGCKKKRKMLGFIEYECVKVKDLNAGCPICEEYINPLTGK